MLEDPSFVIAQIYDASVDATLWKAALARIALFVGVARATPLVEAAAAKNFPALVTSCDDPRRLEHCFQTDLPINDDSAASGFADSSGMRKNKHDR